MRRRGGSRAPPRGPPARGGGAGAPRGGGPPPRGGGAPPPPPRREQARALGILVDRARAAGVVRDDVGVDDVRICLAAIASFRLTRPAVGLHRLVDLLLTGLTADRLPAGSE
ncbi:hypothetical protein ACFW9L_21410 [Streptomyces sp. NPDC059517]|uniref:SbtR family transcriptional regulator n=1 Tax=Streptomyces sp. NPDC059517 TaxID=3346855 RepID=UPI0036893E9B